MAPATIYRKRILLFWSILLCALLSGCVSSDETDTSPSAIVFDVNWQNANTNAGEEVARTALALDCAAENVSSVRASVYPASNDFNLADLDSEDLILNGPVWACSLGTGTIENVPSGSDAIVILNFANAEGYIVFRGQSGTFYLTPGLTVNAGQIRPTYFTPTLTTPSDAAEVPLSGLTLEWDPVEGAIVYRVTISTNSDLSDSQIFEIDAASAEYAPEDLIAGTTYYWQVQAVDFSGNEGIVSETRSFTAEATTPENTAPTASITTPQENDIFEHGQVINFQGTATDAEDESIADASLVWASSIDDQLGTGASLSLSTLSAGNHRITFTVTDSGGLTAVAAVNITVNAQAVNTAPDVTIASPASETIVNEGVAVDFEGAADDPEEGTLEASSLQWSSDIDGPFDPPAVLSAGTHTITLTATDSQGASNTYQITLIVNGLPTATINSPSNGADSLQGEAVSFNGSGYDPENGSMTGGSLVWTSNIDGQIGTGNSFSSSELSLGNHTITLTVFDGDGGTDTAQVGLYIYAKPIYDILGTWNFSTSNQTVNGDCPLGSDSTGACDISYNGQSYVMVFTSGMTCNPSSLCTYYGTKTGDNSYLFSNSAVVDGNGGTVNNTLSFNLSSDTSASGSNSSTFSYATAVICTWTFHVSFSR